MRAIILSAGRGTRLLPRTAHTPKCLLPVRGRETVLEHQLRALAACGVHEARIVVGFKVEQVEASLRERPVPGMRTRTLLNPMYALADNLFSAWLGARELSGDYVLLNGDTLFEPEALARLLAEASAPVTLAVNRKPDYDEDDMKVSLDGQRVCAVSKDLGSPVDAESIGLLLFRGDGPRLFRDELAARLSQPEGLGSYYLAAVDRLARRGVVEAVSLDGQWWQEIDTPSDWVAARAALARRGRIDALPPGRVRPRAGNRCRRAGALALACAVLLWVYGKSALADDPLAEPKPKLEVRGGPDDWLHGPSAKLSSTEGWLRPYVVGAAGVHSDVRRLGIEDPTNRFPDAPCAGRVGGGVELRLDERRSVAVEGSTILEPGPFVTEITEVLGVNLRFSF